MNRFGSFEYDHVDKSLPLVAPRCERLCCSQKGKLLFIPASASDASRHSTFASFIDISLIIFSMSSIVLQIPIYLFIILFSIAYNDIRTVFT